MAIQFSSKREALSLPACAAESKTPYAWYKHATQAGFYVRVSKVNNAGQFERVYVHRYKTQVNGKEKDNRDPLGLVLPGSRADYDDALRKLLAKKKELHQDPVTAVSTRLTVAGAWAFYATERYTNKPATKEKDDAQYTRYLSHLAGRYLDELPRSFWSQFLQELREGTLVVGTKIDKSGAQVPTMLGPLASATLIGVMNTASLLYEIGNKHNGLQGQLSGQNPPRSLRETIGAPNEKSRHIFLRDLGTAWRAADQLIAPWWRDLFRVFVLTGMRRSLLFAMRFDEIDFEKGVYIIEPGKRGAKRRGQKITASTATIRLPMSRYVIDLIRARREFAPDKNGLVWFTPKPTRGRRTKKATDSLSDPRGAWSLIESAIGGMHFSPHDLRRTFASAGAVATRDMFAVGMLLLHSVEKLAQAAQVEAITIRYVDTDEAVERARDAAETITAYVLKLAAMQVEQSQAITEPALDSEIEAAVVEVA